MTTTVPWTGRIAPWSPTRDKWYDRALVLALLVPAPIMLGTSVAPLAAALSALQIAPLWWRRGHPDLCFAAVAAMMIVQLPLTGSPIWGQVAMPFAVYSVAAFSTPRRSLVAVGVGLVGSVVGPIDWTTSLAIGGLYPFVLFVGACALSVVAPWALGMLSRTRRAYVAQLIERGERIEREALQRAELAASDERARIAREMHDVVAHGLSVMVVQADGARYAAASDPSAATQALETIGDTGRESLTEMRRLLGLLRSDDSQTALRPQPGLVDLEYLLAEASGAGMHLTTEVEQPLPDVSPGVGLTVYRIVQESLTNVRKHAGPDPQVRVAVRRLGDGIRVTVEDDGRGASARDDGQGHGVVGMKERVGAVGGSLEAGPRPGGGFRVEALVPVGGGR
ncbi:sensor histidine kinase [Nocardioides iriomotensis]|uniref:histidine kinase n=1 Tax=Nocardioides iriomotensis TaxID=715784 RepID=A0A4Q5J7C9_9ACTN|nr:sensor histidine kinase [Nocardioides iriomotensis]RYU14602.1 sensor histidine kinase [Nocardioides iriomotensis]